MINNESRPMKKIGMSGLMILAVLAAAVAPANARVVTGYSGNPLSGAAGVAPNWDCFSENAGAVTGTGAAGCSGLWEISLPIKNTNFDYTVTFNGRGSPGLGPCCQVYAISSAGDAVATAQRCTTSSTYTSQTFSSIHVATGGSLFLACTGLTAPLTRVLRVDFTDP